MAAAYELTRPEHRGRFQVTVYQSGWRLGGKGASGRGPADRIEEHGLHIWMGFYENAFRLLRECYAELGDDPGRRFADWRDAFSVEPAVGVMGRTAAGGWEPWIAAFAPRTGSPGDPPSARQRFTIAGYLVQIAGMVRAALASLQFEGAASPSSAAGQPFDLRSPDELAAAIAKILKYGVLTTLAGALQALALLETAFRVAAPAWFGRLRGLVEAVATAVRQLAEPLAARDSDARRLWDVIDLNLAVMTGIVRFGLATDPRGFDAIDNYELRDWLKLNGASASALDSPLMHGVYDLAFAYAGADATRPRQAASVALRGTLRMFFTWRGAFFWRMQAGMGDVVFAPFYQVLKRRGAAFRFFHRLENVRLADAAALASGERPYVAALELAVQAEVRNGGEYRPLIDVRGLPCWPARPDFAQLAGGDRLAREGRDFESFADRRAARALTLKVGEDFDAVVLGVGLGAIPHVCGELIARDPRWREMVENLPTVATQAFQVWLREDFATLGWTDPRAVVSGYVHPFDTFADMGHLITEESWPVRPRALGYFCSALADPAPAAGDGPIERAHGPSFASDPDYAGRRRAEVRDNAIRFLARDAAALWPRATGPAGGFRWELLADPAESPAQAAAGRADGVAAGAMAASANRASGASAAAASDRAGTASTGAAYQASVAGAGLASVIVDPPAAGAQPSEARFETQYWSANVNPSDRYAQSPPGSTRFRISPLDNSYDNLTVAGDWTACGLNVGCVEAAVISGQLAAHALSGSPALDEIVGYDHP